MAFESPVFLWRMGIICTLFTDRFHKQEGLAIVRFAVVIVFSVMAVLSSPVFSAGSPTDRALTKFNALYSELLTRHANPGEKWGMRALMVDYRALRDDPQWGILVQSLADFPAADLATDAQRKAFYLNAYNILSIDMVQANWPLRSLKSLGSVFQPVWAHDAGLIDGRTVTLRELENDVLRAMGDPRVHMAINCASMSCPDLRHEPYVASRLDAQLDEQVVRFLNQENKGIIYDRENNVLHLSSIFDWFDDDFASDGGVEAFVRRYRPELASDTRIVSDIPYNWGVNGELDAQALLNLRAGR